MSNKSDHRPLDASELLDTFEQSGPAKLGLSITHDFEHRRIYASLNHKIFGRGQALDIGRFRTIRRLGAGGMGEVYLCDDLSLGRKVAVKRVLGGGSKIEQERLRREARALARFSHDNIVTVHEIGEHEGDLFVAMEYVEGQNLADWISTDPPQATVFSHLIEAGRGLAAAHDADCVHRDFKPENVLIGPDAKVKVADFGLVLDRGLADDLLCEGPDAPEGIPPRLSRAGHIIGTLLYMAPEQIRGEEADPRSDQFAFCTVLYEGLWHESPFPRVGAKQRLEAIERGPLRPPGKDRALFAVVRRGLALDPEQRWPNMQALLDALESARARPRRRRQRGLLVLASAAAIGALVIGLTPRAPQEPSCEDGLVGIWDPSTRSTLAQHTIVSDTKHVESSLQLIVEGLDTWAAAWSEEYIEACEQHERESDLTRARQALARTDCLLHQSRQVSLLVEEIANTDQARVLAAAVGAVHTLPDPTSCSTTLALAGVEPPPAHVATSVAHLRRALDAAHTARILGHWQAARTSALQILAAADTLDYAPLLAEALAELAKIEEESGNAPAAVKHYEEALGLSVSAKHDVLAAELALERLDLAVINPRELEITGQLFRQAETYNKRIGLSQSTRARLAYANGGVAKAHGDPVQAAVRYRDAIDFADEQALELPTYLSALAEVSTDPHEQLQLQRRAHELTSLRFGPEHPRTATFLHRLGAALQRAGMGGHEELHHASVIWSTADPTSPRARVAAADRGLADAMKTGNFERAKAHAHDLRRAYHELWPAGHPEHSKPLLKLAQIYANRADQPGQDSQSLRLEALGFLDDALLLLERRTTSGGLNSRVVEIELRRANQLMMLDRFEQSALILDDVRINSASGSLEAARAQFTRAELALRRGSIVEADKLLATLEYEPREGELLGYALLKAFVAHRLGRSIDPTPHDPMLSSWLIELGADSDDLEALGLAAPS